MSNGGNGGQDFTIDVSTLLTSSQLKSLAGQAKPLFKFGMEIAPYLDRPISAVPNGTSAAITVSGSGNWTAGSVGFGLSTSAKCQLKIANSGPVLTYAPDLESGSTANLPASAYPNWTYLVIGLDFDITGNLSGAGTTGSIGVSGKINGSAETSVTFCHVVRSTMNFRDALVEAFNEFVFPFHPECAAEMSPGDIAQVNFTGCLACSFAVSYGITDVKFSAPGVASVLDSITRGAANFTLPAGKIDIGATASLGYTHSDCFTAIVQKRDASSAFLYILRADKSDLTGGLKITASISITSPAAITVNAAAVQRAINAIARTGGERAANAATQIASGLSAKLNSWINDAISGGASLGATWDRQKTASMLFKYTVNLADSRKLASSWNDLCKGDLVRAVSEGGLVPDPGSGISNQLNKSFTLGLHFFNLFSATSISTYFQKTYVTITATGDIRYMFDIGNESETDVNKSKRICVVHFIGTVNESTAQTISSADVELAVDLTATNNAKEAARMANVLNAMPTSEQVTQAKAAVAKFAASGAASGTLKMSYQFKASGYGRLQCSPFTGRTPPTDQTQDAKNWQAFHDAVMVLPDMSWTSVFKYTDWQRFNKACRTQVGFPQPALANRRDPGNRQAITPGFWDGTSSQNNALISYFLQSVADFLNLCEDLCALAQVAPPSGGGNVVEVYNDVLASLVNLIIKNDVDTDYSKPALAALLKLVAPSSVQCQATSAKSSLTYLFTIS